MNGGGRATTNKVGQRLGQTPCSSDCELETLESQLREAAAELTNLRARRSSGWND